MEMSIPILEQQQAPVTIPATSGKNANAKQADAGQDSFKTTFDKTMDKADKGKTASTQGETESVQKEDTVAEEPCTDSSTARMFFVAVSPIICQTAMELPTGAEPAAIESLEGVVAINTISDMGNGEMNPQKIQAIIPSETPVASNQKSAPADLTATSKMQSSIQEAEITLVQNNTPLVDSAAKTVPVMMGQEEGTPVQNVKPMPVGMAGKPEATMPAIPAQTDEKSVNIQANTDLTTQTSVSNADAAKAAEGEITVAPLKAEDQPVEKKGPVSKEAFTVIAVPGTETSEQQSSAGGFNHDKAENPHVMTPATAMPSAKADTVNVPFPAVKAPPPVKEQVFQEIVQKARIMSDGTQQQIQIQLKPEHLGPLNVQIAVENGVVTAKFQTDNPQVKQVLEASFNQLKQDLQTQGLKVQHVEVSIAQQGMSFSEFSRQTPQFSLIKSKRIGQGEGDAAEQFLAKTSLIENYGGLHSGEVDYRI